MRTIFSNVMILGYLIVSPLAAIAQVHIFACEPEWASLSREIGGDKVIVFSATSAMQDPHYIRAKPSLFAKIRKSDLVIGSGASLEIGWLPILLRKAGNERVQPGSVGFLMAAEVIPMLEKPESVDRSQGDVHPEGNPHMHLDPHNIAAIAKELADRLAHINEANRRYYRSRYVAFSKKWKDATTGWEREGLPLKGMPVVVHHTSFTYLENWLGLKRVSTLEPKPGIPSTTAHLESLLRTLRTNHARVILRTPYNPEKPSLWLSKKTGLPALELPYTVGGDEQSSDLFALYDRTLTLLKEAVHGKQ